MAMKHNSGNRHDMLRLAVCQALVLLYEAIVPMGDLAKVPKIGFLLCNVYFKLAKEALDLGSKTWKLAPKFHMLLHICEWQTPRFGSPRLWWTYADEDLVGHMMEVGKSTHPRTVATMSLFKWLHLFFANEL